MHNSDRACKVVFVFFGGKDMRSSGLVLAIAVLSLATAAHGADNFEVSITVDAARAGPALTPIWRFFGADEPNYATMKDGRQLLGELGALKQDDIYFRAHNLLSSGDGTPALKWGSSNAYTEDAAGNPRYDWHVIDGIFDAYLSNGVRPFVQLGFMPQALSSAPASVPYKHSWRPGFDYNLISGGWGYPPKDYSRWSELCFQLTQHLVQRYGEAEVRRWWFETWNEPNGPAYWKSTAEEFYKLHDYAVAGVRRALPTARVGGPHTAGHGGAYMEGFLDHITTGKNFATGEPGTPTDFLAFHAKGAPTFVDGHVRMGIQTQLATIDKGFQMIAARPTLAGKPIIIGESDPEGCAACQGPRFGYRNGTMYSSYTAASFARKHELAARHKVNLQGALTWAFEFEDQPYFAGFRQLASNGIDMPVMNVFRMFSHMGGALVPAKSSGQIPLDDVLAKGIGGAADVGVMASRNGDELAILVWHYHDDDVPGPDALVKLTISGLPRGVPAITHYRIDQRHSNSYAAWQRMGSPIAPDKAAYDTLRANGQLARLAGQTDARRSGNALELQFDLPRQGVSLLLVPVARR
jgi:xylan 1,4-beta-xylosidase